MPSARLSKWSSAAATRGFFLTADYAFGHSLERGTTQVIVQNGGKVIGSVAHPFTTPDLSSFILQAQFSKGKIIGLASGPPDNVDAIKLVGESGIFTGGQQMAGLLCPDHRRPRAWP